MDMAIEPSGSFLVTETQTVNFSGGTSRFGYTEIPLTRLNSITDVTSRRTRESQGAKHVSDLRTLINAIPTFVAYVTADLHFVAVNAPYSSRFGLTPDACVGRRVVDVVGVEPFNRMLPYMQRALAGETVEVELDVNYEHGRRYVAFQFVPHLDERGRVIGFIGSGLDVTDRRLLEESLREADRQKDQMIGLISHEIRNCLTPLQSGVGLWRAEVAEAVQARARGIMQRQIEQLTRLTNDLIDLARIRQSTLTLTTARYDIRQAVADAVDAAMPLIAARHHEITVNLDDGPLPVIGDRQRLLQVFTNLVSNAKRYTPEGGHIRVDAARRGGEVVVAVSDNGPGFSPDLLPQLFEPFVRGTSRENVPAGLGLGLHIVKEIVRLHGGEVTAENQATGGARMIVSVPLAPDA